MTVEIKKNFFAVVDFDIEIEILCSYKGIKKLL